jgi:hypothetical protein
VFRDEHKIRESTGQPYVELGSLITQIKESIAAYLFISRSIFDCIATLFHFLYGAESKRFDSFSEYIKALKSGKVNDPDMANFIKNEMKWFMKLRDLRDYVTHYGSLEVYLYMIDSGDLVMRIEDFEIEEIMNGTMTGIREFLIFFDNHFAEIIKAENSISNSTMQS